jgi:hypothetical protein
LQDRPKIFIRLKSIGAIIAFRWRRNAQQNRKETRHRDRRRRMRSFWLLLQGTLCENQSV